MWLWGLVDQIFASNPGWVPKTLNWPCRVPHTGGFRGWVLCGGGSDYKRGRSSETPGDAILLAETVVPGGRVELPTPAFSGPRSTGELPRHRSSQKIVRAREAGSKRSGVARVGQILMSELLGTWRGLKEFSSRLRKNSKRCHSERSEESVLVSLLILKSKRDSSLRSE